MPLRSLLDSCNSWIEKTWRDGGQTLFHPFALITQKEQVYIERSGRAAARFFDLHLSTLFKPVLDLNTLQVVGYEALLQALRDHQALTPSEVFTGLTTHESIYLDRLCRAVHALNFVARGGPGLLFCQVQPVLLKGVAEAHGEVFTKVLQLCGLSPTQVVIEISAGFLTENVIRGEAILRNYRRRGFSVALRDFSLGPQALEYLWELQPNLVALSPTMIAQVQANTPLQRHFDRRISLIRELYGIRVLARGIAMESQVRAVRGWGVELVQGDYFTER